VALTGAGRVRLQRSARAAVRTLDDCAKLAIRRGRVLAAVDDDLAMTAVLLRQLTLERFAVVDAARIQQVRENFVMNAVQPILWEEPRNA
jgi:hypothetical protein